jgi:hypothetical protein
MNSFLLEQTHGLDHFLNEITEIHPDFIKFSDKVKQFILDSECKKIEFSNFRLPAMGIALHNFVMINKTALKSPLPYLLFVIFHEIAHQYQFKKYGNEIMYKCYMNEIDIEEAADFMKKTEIVADEFATRKVREFIKLGYIDKSFSPPQFYKNIPLQQLKAMISNFRNELKKRNYSTPETISEWFYNTVKSEL